MAEQPLRKLFVLLGVEMDEKGLKKAENGLTKLKNVAKTLGAVFVTGAVAVGFNKLISFASAAEERSNKFRAVFVDAADDIQRQLDDISSRTGIAGGQLQAFAADIGAIVKPALGSADAAGKMGASVAELALDIASFNDVEPTDALIALRSGLIGSAEPLQRFGVDTRVAALEAEALRQGITKSVEAMSEGERQQLRFATIMRQLGAQGALGDATRTADGLANATRGLSSQFKQLGEIIGSFFLKDAALSTVRLRGLVEVVNQWIIANDAIIRQRIDQVLQVINNTIKGIAFGVQFLIGGFQALAEVIGPVATGVLIAVGAIAALVAILGAPIVAIIALGVAIGLVIDDLVVFAEGGESLFGILIAGIQNFFKEFANTGTVFGDLMQFFTDVFNSAVTLWDDIVAEWLPSISAFFVKALDKITEFTKIGIAKAKVLFEGLADTVGEALKSIFGGTIGRIIIDFLGAKAGAAVGEFIGRLVGKLAGKLTGKGVVGRAISSRISQELIGFLGKGVGAITGGLAADELALGLQRFISAPAAAGGGRSFQGGATETNITINASGEAVRDPQVLGGVVRRQVEAANEQALRQTNDAFVVAAAEGG